jgi:hypothetical protein
VGTCPGQQPPANAPDPNSLFQPGPDNSGSTPATDNGATTPATGSTASTGGSGNATSTSGSGNATDNSGSSGATDNSGSGNATDNSSQAPDTSGSSTLAPVPAGGAASGSGKNQKPSTSLFTDPLPATNTTTTQETSLNIWAIAGAALIILAVITGHVVTTLRQRGRRKRAAADSV